VLVLGERSRRVVSQMLESRLRGSVVVGILLILLVVLFFTHASTEGITLAEGVFTVVFATLMFVHGIFGLTTRSSYAIRIVKANVKVLGVGLFLVVYGVLLAAYHGHDVRYWYLDVYRFIPILACFPAAAWIRTERQWKVLLGGVVVLGLAASLRDLATMGASGIVIRLAFTELANIDYLVGLVLCLGVMICERARALRVLTALAIIPLLARTFFAVNRIALAALAICMLLLYAKAAKMRRVGSAVVISSLLAVSVGLGSRYLAGGVIESYWNLWTLRIGRSDVGLLLRGAEANTVFEIVKKKPLGDGFGSVGYFGVFHALAPKSALTEKAYVHNLFLFMLWKLGIVGVVLCGLLLTALVRLVKWAWDCEDPLVWVVTVSLVSLFVYSLGETLFMRHDFNLLGGILLGYTIYRRHPPIGGPGPAGEDGTTGRSAGPDSVGNPPGQAGPGGMSAGRGASNHRLAGMSPL